MSKIAGLIAAAGGKVLTAVSTIIAFELIVYSSYVLYDTVYTNRSAFMSSDLSQYRPTVTEEEPGFEELMEVNPDTCAWITMTGTHIDYPVVQGKDDLEYSMKDIYGNSSLTGSIYLTTVNTRDFTNSFNLIYGHHMDNGAMFGDIEKYEDDNYFRTHKSGILITTRGVYDLHVFARLSADAYDSRIYSAGDRPSSDFPNFLYYVRDLSVQWEPDTDIEGITKNIQTYISARDKNIAENGRFVFSKMPEDAVKNGMQLIALSTCADAVTNGRQVLVATMKFRTEPLPTELIPDLDVPRAAWGHGEASHWALLNLICVIMIAAILLPGRRLRDKYSRISDIAKRCKEDEQLNVRRLLSEPAVTGVLLELLITVFSMLWFFLTEDIHKPMTILDSWTLGMIALFAAMWAVDVFLVRYNRKRTEAIDAQSAD